MPLRQRGLGLVGHHCIAFTMIGTALGVPDDHVAAAELGQHRHRHLAGVGALLVRRAVLGAPADVAAGQVQRPPRGRETAGTPPRRSQRGAPCDTGQQFGIGLVAAVHLPVAHHQLASHVVQFLCCHDSADQRSTILPTCWFDSIRAWASAACAAGTHWWMTGLTRPPPARARPLRAGARNGRLEGDRARTQRGAGDGQAACAAPRPRRSGRLAALHRDERQPAVIGQALSSRAT
jgi:hypothetical protein